MSYTPRFSPEEQDFIESTKRLLESDSKSKTLLEAMIGLASDCMDAGGLVFNNHNLSFLAQISNDPSIKAQAELRQHTKRCPECNKRLVGLCGRLECTDCRLVFFYESPNTRAQCPGCTSYRDRSDPNYARDAYEGFGTGCPSVHGRGDEIEKYARMKEKGTIDPAKWRASQDV